MFRAVIFLAILQHLLSDWYCFAKLARAAQFLNFLNHLTNVRRFLAWSRTETYRNRAKKCHATQPAINQSLDPGKIFDQLFHDSRVGYNTTQLQANSAGRHGGALGPFSRWIPLCWLLVLPI